jgi:hypothetical protein
VKGEVELSKCGFRSLTTARPSLITASSMSGARRRRLAAGSWSYSRRVCRGVSGSSQPPESLASWLMPPSGSG